MKQLKETEVKRQCDPSYDHDYRLKRRLKRGSNEKTIENEDGNERAESDISFLIILFFSVHRVFSSEDKETHSY